MNTFTTIGQIVVRQLDRSVIMNFAFFVIHYIQKSSYCLHLGTYLIIIDLNEFESAVYLYRPYSFHCMNHLYCGNGSMKKTIITINQKNRAVSNLRVA